MIWVDAKSQTALPIKYNLIPIDFERDSICSVIEPTETRHLNKEHASLTVKTKSQVEIYQRNVGKAYNLWTKDKTNPYADQLIIQDAIGRVYWLDNKNHNLRMYQGGRLIWEQSTKISFRQTGVHHLQLRGELIFISAAPCTSGFNRANGKEEWQGCD
ncbi:hypothetical protein GCM10023185_45560 [Hymenobacter saemangeumensis]|uniref:Uncharacterized protein n=2 Tax=Hymenobacter saemangeumensis TaxID=1084522 RepID=A0ABP8ISP0_9BACT